MFLRMSYSQLGVKDDGSLLQYHRQQIRPESPGSGKHTVEPLLSSHPVEWPFLAA